MVPARDPVSVVMALDRGGPHAAKAFSSIDAQLLRDDELVVVDHGGTPALTPVLEREIRQGAAEASVRILRCPGKNLAGALNVGLREARSVLVARMDADDVSLSGRLDAQVGYLSQHPEVAVVGTAFERIDDRGDVIERATLPTDPREVRWRLLIENCLAHGSVMFRRDDVLAAGGYDESCERAQDYDLWLRMAGRYQLANLPQVLYRYRTCAGTGPWFSSPEQAVVASRALARAWAELPAGDQDEQLQTAMASVLSSPPAGAHSIEKLLTELGPTRERLMAWLWASKLRAPAQGPNVEAGKRALLREAGERVRRSGARSVRLWGAGKHTVWVLQNAEHLGVRVSGIVDDRHAGKLLGGHVVAHPSDLARGEHVLLSSDAHEDELWTSSATHRARGVHIWRVYGSTDAIVGTPVEVAA